jgi:hypothetical protein
VKRREICVDLKRKIKESVLKPSITYKTTKSSYFYNTTNKCNSTNNNKAVISMEELEDQDLFSLKFHLSYHGLSPLFTLSTRRTSRQTTQFVIMTHFLSLLQYHPHTGVYSIEELLPFSLLMMVPQVIIFGSYLTLLDRWFNPVQLLSVYKLS